MRLASVRQELEEERNSAQEARARLAQLAQQPDVLGQEVLRLQLKLQDAEDAQGALATERDVSQGNYITAAEEVRRLQATLSKAVGEEEHAEKRRAQALAE